MRPIVYLTGAFPKRSETYIQQELKLLLAQGLPMVVVAVNAGDMSLPDDLPSPLYLQPAAPGRGGSGTAPAVSRQPFQCWRRRLSLLRHRTARRRLYQLVKRTGARHILAAVGDLPGLLAAQVAADAGISYSLSVHARDVLVPKYDDACLFDLSRLVLTCNQLATDALRRRRPLLDDRLQMVPHGLCLDDWPLRPATFAPGPVLRQLAVGRLLPKKGFDRAIALLCQQAATGLASQLTIIGEGPALAELQALAAPVTDRVTFVGACSRHEVAARMVEHDLLLLPSRVTDDGDQEGIPNVMLEAMATGLPVVAAPTGGISEVLSETTGYGVNFDDPAATVACIRRLIELPAAVRARAAAARQRVERDFDARRLIARRRDLLQAASD